MKKYQRALRFLFISCLQLSAWQSPGQVFNLDNIPKNGIVLDKEWKFHAGDDSDWRELSFNDSGWNVIDPTKPIQYLPQVQVAQIGWIRLRFHADRALRGKMIAMTIKQIGASEIYLNGNLIQWYGKVSSNFDEEETYNPLGVPLTVQLGEAPEQILAIRYSFNKRNLCPNVRYNNFFRLLLSKPLTAWNNYINYFVARYIHRSVVWGIFVFLSILQISIYLANPNRKINLYLSLFAFFQSCTFIDGPLGPLLHSSSSQFYMLAVFFIAAHITLVLFLWVVYKLFNQPKNWWFKLMAGLCLFSLPLEFGQKNTLVYSILAGCGMLVYVENLRISLIAFRKSYPGSTLFSIGQGIAFVFFGAFNIFPNSSYNYLLFEADIAFLTPAVVISIFLAREFAQNNILLKQQLKKVEILSEKNLAQELERQHLLASQNEMLENQVQQRTNELSESLRNLQLTQAQLIQSEKMASLGELTAGIAHEIQNPLNFINNFSEVNTELIAEMNHEIDKGNIEEVKVIANDIAANEHIINHHGKRADAIVKGMLQHSRSSSGVKEATNINALANEYLRLAYHGLRAKDKSFNATMKTDFDNSIGNINVIPQDIGRVILNLITNAFYAVDEKKKSAYAKAPAGKEYEPIVLVTTKKVGQKVEIKVKDNGNGIPHKLMDKIFQPFFTTKPTGQGTGLGLSLSYDIIKAHGGEIKLDTKEGEGAEFVITLNNS